MLSRLREERGISLVLAMLVMTVLSVTTAGMIAYTSAGSRTVSIERSRVSARALAEAGLNNALSIVNKAVDPKTGTLLPQFGVAGRSFTLEGGTATVWGQYFQTEDHGVWTIRSTGSVTNPTGGAPLTRTLTQTANVYGLNDGSTVAEWSRMIHEDDDPNNCLVIEDVTIPVPVASGGCIKLRGTAKIVGAATTVEAGSNVTLEGSSGTTAQAPGSASGWSNSSRVYTSNNSDATNSINGSSTGDYLDVTNFGFALPATATVTGIRVEVEREASSSSSLRDETVRLLRAGSTVGDNKAVTNQYWDNDEETKSYGSVTGTLDTWNAGLTAAQVNASSFGVRLRVRNYSSHSRTAYVDYVRITVAWTAQPTSSIGESGSNVLKADVGGTCKWGTQASHTPCSATDRVYSTEYLSAPQDLVKPTIDLDYWYKNARPGPAHDCDNAGGSFSGGFDNNYSSWNPHPDNSRNWTYGSAEVTPKNSDYTCQVHDPASGALLGEISWNHTTKVLKIKGTVYIDGDFRFDDDGEVVHYQGRGIIYATGNLEFDELVCAGGQAPQSCYPNMSDWDPTQNMMTVLANGWAEFDQGSTATLNTKQGGLQGIIYSNSKCQVHQWFHLSGPIICDWIELPVDAGWHLPQYYTWPSLGSLTEGQKYGSIEDAGDFDIIPGPITG